MTSKTDFTEEEWTTLLRAPIVAGLGISLADPGGPIELTKEQLATLQHATTPVEGEGLVVEIAKDLKVSLDSKQNPMSDFEPDKGEGPYEFLLGELENANRIVTDKASPEEAAKYKAWVLESAQKAAEAAKEGGFFGIGAVLVSEGESNMLAKLQEVFK
ncbi:MAG TPA: hypothetical protein VID03_00900 [Acidimicrobiia bacterium]|jgi:hypothetical protein